MMAATLEFGDGSGGGGGTTRTKPDSGAYDVRLGTNILTHASLPNPRNAK